MTIIFYGTGSCMPLAKSSNKPFRSYTGWYTEIGKDSLLFDIGGGVLHKMLSDGVDVMKKPSHLFISHFHPDHCSDIIALMQGRGVANMWGKKIETLFVGAPYGLKQFAKELFENVFKWASFKEDLNVYKLLNLKETMSGSVVKTKSWEVKCAPIKHFDGVCFRLDAEGKSVVYSGDMVYDENICKLGKNADVAIMECSFPDKSSLQGAHLCPEDIGKLAKIGNFKKVVLTHMYPECEGREEEMIKTIKQIVDVEVVVAYDGLRLVI